MISTEYFLSIFLFGIIHISFYSFVDGEDPAPKFFSSDIQILLKRLTRPDFAKVFRRRANSNEPVLQTPVYKFLTDEELQIERQKAYKSADRLLQMPPVVKVKFSIIKHINDPFSYQKCIK